MELKQTVDMMCSDNYKDRVIAEYQQLAIRQKKLRKLIIEITAAEICGKRVANEKKVECPLYILENQYNAMDEYLRSLEIRAEIESIDLNSRTIQIF